MILSGFTRVIEGTTELTVPEGFCKKGPGKRTGEVFYNRQMEFARDISVIVGREIFIEGQKILDGLAATGARGLRLANECAARADFQLNDRDLRAAVLMKQNAELNSLGHVKIHCRDLKSLLADEQYDYIDIDPFGSPVEFVDAAVQSCRNKGVIAVTATDTAPLCGTYPKTCLRRYGALSARSPFAHESGLRILIGYIVREAAKHDRAIEPILCYYADHYFRCYLAIQNGASNADAAMRRMGFARYEQTSLRRSLDSERQSNKDAGPMWTGELFSEELLGKMKATGDLNTAARCAKMIETWRDEVDAPSLFFTIDELAKKTKLAPPKLGDFVHFLTKEGAKASRTHFDPKGFKASLTASELVQEYRKYSKRV